MSTSFAITAYNEMSPQRGSGAKILRCLKAAQNHPGIDEIVVVDDCSEDCDGLEHLLRGQAKVSLFRNPHNYGVFGNKLEAIARATGDWVITCDSDNSMDSTFIDKVLSLATDQSVWLCASFARPRFNYRPLASDTPYTLTSISQIVPHPIFCCFFNTGNQTVARRSFLNVFGQYRGIRADRQLPNWLELSEQDLQSTYYEQVFDANDSFVYNLLWLLAGNKLRIVPGLEYDHYYAAGEEGNYLRSPPEKVALGQRLLQALKTEIKKQHV